MPNGITSAQNQTVCINRMTTIAKSTNYIDLFGFDQMDLINKMKTLSVIILTQIVFLIPLNGKRNLTCILPSLLESDASLLDIFRSRTKSPPEVKNNGHDKVYSKMYFKLEMIIMVK